MELFVSFAQKRLCNFFWNTLAKYEKREYDNTIVRPLPKSGGEKGAIDVWRSFLQWCWPWSWCWAWPPAAARMMLWWTTRNASKKIWAKWTTETGSNLLPVSLFANLVGVAGRSCKMWKVKEKKLQKVNGNLAKQK